MPADDRTRHESLVRNQRLLERRARMEARGV